MDNYILSAPVYDAAARQYVGFLDMKDLVSVVVFVADRKVEDTDHISKLLKSYQTYRYQTEGLTVTCSYFLYLFHRFLRVADLARRHPFHPVPIGSPLLKAAEFMERRIHRIPIIDASGRAVKILSQSAVVKFLATHVRVIRPYRCAMLNQMGLLIAQCLMFVVLDGIVG